jgi:murein DD-endopeptidase MepM/ murein hydrolase activator NlpD
MGRTARHIVRRFGKARCIELIDFKVFAKGRMVAGASVAAASAFFGAHPALANSSNATDISAPLRAAQEAKLFSNWRDLDRQAGFTARPIPAPAFGLVAVHERGVAQQSGFSPRVSIPSRVPLDGMHFTSGFGMRMHPILGRRKAHKGVDLAAPVGTPVYAPADGTVGRADWFSSYGLYIQLEHGADIETRYGHLSRLNVSAGQHVHKGDLIGFVGTTGRSTGPHLHYEVRIAGQAVNPVPYMQGDQVQAATAIANVPAVAFGGTSRRR